MTPPISATGAQKGPEQSGGQTLPETALTGQAAIDAERAEQLRTAEHAEEQTKRKELSKQIISEKLDKLREEAGSKGKDLDWDNDTVLGYAVSQAESIFKNVPEDLPENLNDDRKDWMKAFSDEYLVQLDKQDWRGCDLDEKDVRIARDLTTQKIKAFSLWLKENRQDKSIIYEAFIESKKQNPRIGADGEPIDDSEDGAAQPAGPTQPGQPSSQPGTTGQPEAPKPPDLSGRPIVTPNPVLSDADKTRKTTLSQLADESLTKFAAFEGIKIGLSEIKSKLAQAGTTEDLAEIESALESFKNPDLITKLQRIKSSLDPLSNKRKEAINMLGIPENTLESELENLAQTYEQLPIDIDATTRSFDGIEKRINGLEKIANAVSSAPVPVSDEEISEMLSALTQTDEDPDAIIAKLTESNKKKNTDIEAIPADGKASMIDGLLARTETMEDGYIKGFFLQILGLIKSAKDFLGSVGLVPKKWSSTQDLINAGDADTIYGINSVRHMRRFGLDSSFIDRVKGAKVSDVLKTCENEGKSNSRIFWFAKNLKDLASKVDGGMEKSVITVIGGADVSFARYRPWKSDIPAPQPTTAPPPVITQPPAPTTGTATGATTTTPPPTTTTTPPPPTTTPPGTTTTTPPPPKP